MYDWMSRLFFQSCLETNDYMCFGIQNPQKLQLENQDVGASGCLEMLGWSLRVIWYMTREMILFVSLWPFFGWLSDPFKTYLSDLQLRDHHHQVTAWITLHGFLFPKESGYQKVQELPLMCGKSGPSRDDNMAYCLSPEIRGSGSIP